MCSNRDFANPDLLPTYSYSEPQTHTLILGGRLK